MNISVRLFLGYFLTLGLAAWFVLNIFSHETEPGIRQATEETLVDTAHVLAELAAQDLANNRIGTGTFAASIRAAGRRTPQASISGVYKDTVDFRVYVTDAQGIVVYDSEGTARGADYSHWRDVSRVLRGEYGARSTREDPDDPRSSVMYVAAPIFWQGERIGVLSVAKPIASVMPYIDRAATRVKRAGLVMLAASAFIGLVFSAWLTFSINRLRAYARDVAAGRRAEPPTTGGTQFSELARALAAMREKLEGKQYVENYVQNLAHEMKSPLTAVVGAAEILKEDPPAEDRRRFVGSILDQSRRLQQIIERMLMLARVEQLQSPEGKAEISMAELAQQCIASRAAALERRSLDCRLDARTEGRLRGDAFLLQQALSNLLDNAIEFSPAGAAIDITLDEQDGQLEIAVRDHGSGAPDYALPHLFERFYSLPRPATGQKSTGLGLPFVREVARLHGGDARFGNHPEGGAEVALLLPLPR
ncbi:MAG: two-component system sensor histidine kinase CreC [Actinomycetota bacterium]